MAFRKILLCLAALLAGLSVRAQFYTGGDDPAAIRWSTFRTDHYKLIYPRGLDSLARVYARSLEEFRPKVGRSIGYLPGGLYKRPMPVVLHVFSGESNGSVSWAPMRMDLYTLPDAYSPEPMPWITSLAVHENRHVAQLQFGSDGLFRPLKWLFGDLFTGAAAGIWPNLWFLEGDAVVAETALTPCGRGRQGEFLAYYRAAFDRGDWRNWYRWRHGSWRYFAPNHYALGYLTLAGARTLYDQPLFDAAYLTGAARKPWRLFPSRKALRQASGRSFKETFRDIEQFFQDQWTAENRGPFTKTEPLTDIPSWYTTQTSPLHFNGQLLGLSASKLNATELVAFQDGAAKHLRPFSAAGSELRTDGKRIYWSETIPDVRWTLAATSRVRYLEDGKVHDLTTTGKIYNPSPSPDGSRIALVEYPADGSFKIHLLSAETALPQQIRTLPEGIQPVEIAWLTDTEYYFSFICDEGSGIAFLDLAGGGPPQTVLTPQPVSIAHLQSHPAGITFSCDRTGVNEIYRLTPEGRLVQLTATPYGATSHTFVGDTLVFSAQQYEGRLLQKVLPEQLLNREADWSEVAVHPVAEELAEQERALAAADLPLKDRNKGLPDGSEFSEVKPYRKLPGIFHLHSWAPFFFNYDRISELSGDISWREAGVGATLLFQNLLGTSDMTLGYGYHEDPYTSSWRHSGHAKLTWSGWYPVFELTVDFNDRNPLRYTRIRQQQADGQVTTAVRGALADGLGLQAGLKAYVPLNFSRGGWNRGFIPQVQYSWSNDIFDKGLTVVTLPEEGSSDAPIINETPGKTVRMQSLTATLRGYVTRTKAPSQEYPRWGLGLEAGYRTRIGLDDLYSSAIYTYAYGYLPGITRNHGLRLTATWQHQNSAPNGENLVTTRPRGFEDTDLSTWLATHARNQVKLSADYAIPFWVGDLSWFSPFFYVTHFVITPHADWLYFSGDRNGAGSGSLASLGADWTVRLANFLWLPYETSVGLRFDWNGGASYDRIDASAPLTRTYIGGIFSIDF